MSIKFEIWNESLECYKKHSLFAKCAIQNNSDALAATHLKWKNYNDSTWVKFNSSLWWNASAQVELFSFLFFKRVDTLIRLIN